MAPYTQALPRARAPYVIGAGLIVAFAAAAALMHAAISSHHSSGGPPPAAAPAADGATPAAPSAQSMQTAIAGLEARLARGGGSDADWELLAKAYEFVGRTDDARRARSRIVSASPDLATLMAAAEAAGGSPGPAAAAPSPAAPRGVAPSSPAMSLEELRRRVQTHPDDAPSWLALAELYRERHDDPAARDALARVVALHGMTAQSWADYADVLASLAGGSLSGPAGSAIDSALALDPANPKALWLKASQAHEQHHFGDALTWWHKLRAVLPVDSPDLRVIDANIAEDTQLGGPGLSGTARASN